MMAGLSRFTGLAALCVPALTSAQINRSKEVAPLSQNIYDLHIMGIWIVVGIMAVVYGIIIYSLIRHRKSKRAIASTFRHNIVPELLWTIIPLVIIAIIAAPSISALVEMHD
jgi:cytochrome c oxidase subunit 2